MTTNKTPVGEVRPSQLLWTYGPGALIDLPSLSVVTLGIDQWEMDRCQPIAEPRLLAAVRKVLGVQVESLRMPPFQKSELVDPWSAEANIGVPVRPFPRWMRCVKCGLLSPFDAGLFEIKENRFRPERTRFVHKACRGSKGDQPAKDADAVPARFLLACRDGHLDDFPWHYFVHGGNSSCKKSTLRFFESGASLQTENLWVKCDACGASRSMAHAFGKAGKENLPSCRGRHPHLDHFDEECDEEARAVLLGSTNSWFPITLSALAIPQANDPLGQLVQDGWEFFEDLDSEAAVAVAVKMLKKTGALPGIDKYPASDIWAAIKAHRNGGDQETVGEADIKGPEWEVLTAANPPADYPHFMSKKVGIPTGFENRIARVLLLERLREVNALLGFTRVEAPEESSDPNVRPQMAGLARFKPDWVPANQVHGEGIFIQFDEAALRIGKPWLASSAWTECSELVMVDGAIRATSIRTRATRASATPCYTRSRTCSSANWRWNAATTQRASENVSTPMCRVPIRKRVSSSTRRPLILMGRWVASSISASPRTLVGFCGRR